MKMLHFLSLAAAVAFAGCASGHFSSSDKSIAVRTTPQKEIVVLAPDKANVFTTMAREQNNWLTAQIQAAITHELSLSSRFQPGKGGAGDAQIVFNSLRHGLLEVSANNYAVQVVAEVSLLGHGGKKVGDREITSTSGNIHTLADFEDSKTYQEALLSAAEKLSLELVSDL